LSTAAGEPTATHPRNLIVVGPGSQVSVVESYAGVGSGVYLTNAVTEVVLEDETRLDHSRIQLESERAFHVGTVAVRQRGRAATTPRSPSLRRTAATCCCPTVAASAASRSSRSSPTT